MKKRYGLSRNVCIALVVSAVCILSIWGVRTFLRHCTEEQAAKDIAQNGVTEQQMLESLSQNRQQFEEVARLCVASEPLHRVEVASHENRVFYDSLQDETKAALFTEEERAEVDALLAETKCLDIERRTQSVFDYSTEKHKIHVTIVFTFQGTEAWGQRNYLVYSSLADAESENVESNVRFALPKNDPELHKLDAHWYWAQMD